MENYLNELFDEAIRLERGLGDLYNLFSRSIPEDKEFWKELALEEKRHGALLDMCRDISMELWQFPGDLLPKSVKPVQESNRRLAAFSEKYTKYPPTREDAFNAALVLENSAGEIHYQTAMTLPPKSKMMQVFQQLNRDDSDHLLRIKGYMEENLVALRLASACP